jgi:hypothetical protein
MAEWENRKMTDLISAAIRELQHRKAALEKALEALREMDGDTGGPSASVSIPATGRKGKKRSAAVRKRMREAQRARWERIRAEADRVPF